MTMKTYTKPALYRENLPSHGADRSSSTAAHVSLEFGRFRVLLRQRQLIADGAPVELGTRALDLLLVLLEADGSLVTKEELFRHVWPGIVVAEENLKVQISALRKARRRPRFYSDRVRPRLPVHCRSSLGRCLGCLSRSGATTAPTKSRIASPMDFSATTAPTVRPELRLALRRPSLTGIGSVQPSV